MRDKAQGYYNNPREDIVKLVPDNARRILDVGCAAGLMAQALKSRSGHAIEIIGIELVPEIAQKAKEHLDKVFIGNVEMMEMPFDKGYFDCIIYGDVLEHLINPWDLLVKHREFLKDGGCVIASIPNIAHYRVIKMLKRREWNYQDAGIMDATHLRFFAINNIKEMFKKSGFDIKKIEHIICGSNVKKFLNRISRGMLLDYITEEYIVVAKKL